MNNTHKVEIVPITLEPHSNADSLSIVRVFGYTVVVRTADWQGKTLGAYLPPDSVAPNNETFAFLEGRTRITVVLWPTRVALAQCASVTNPRAVRRRAGILRCTV